MDEILLLVPAFEDGLGNEDLGSQNNLGVGYICSYLESKGYRVTLIDSNPEKLTNEAMMKSLEGSGYSLIGISCTSQKVYPSARDVTKAARRLFPKSHITMGGVFTTHDYASIMQDIPELNTIVVGEGEIAFRELADSLREGADFRHIDGLVYRNGNGLGFNKPKRLTDLTALPFPRRSSREGDGRELRVVAGRGCYGRCAFCSLGWYSRGKAYRDPANILDEMEELKQKYNVNQVRFADDLFYDRSQQGRDWLENFLSEIEKRKLGMKFGQIGLRATDILEEDMARLKRAGLTSVLVGVESGVPRILKEMRKDYTTLNSLNAMRILTKQNIRIDMGFILMIPTITYPELKDNLRFLLSTGLYTEKSFYDKLNLYNGLEYVDILKKKGLLLPKEHFWERHNYVFADSLVQKYHDVVVNVRLEALPGKLRLNKICDICWRNSIPDLANQFLALHAATWAKMVNAALAMIDEDPGYDVARIREVLLPYVYELRSRTDATLADLERAYGPSELPDSDDKGT